LKAPDARRSITDDVLRARLRAFARAAEKGAGGELQAVPFNLGLVQELYVEGNVLVLRNGRDLARASRLMISPIDDRMVLRDATLRVLSPADTTGPRMMVVRGNKLVRQGRRTTGRNVSVTTCSAGEPHFEVISGELEMIEHDQKIEVRTRDNELAFSGTGVVPLPNASFFTGDQNNIPLRGVTAGYSNRQGFEGTIEFGGSLSGLGPVNEWLTGRPAYEFSGDWRLDLGWIEARGFPIEGELNYNTDNLYHGYFRGFYLDDQGQNIREIRNNVDGSLITNTNRRLLWSENRIYSSEHSSLDLTLFDASDAAVLSEFFPREYREHEEPETSLVYTHGNENRLLTATVRANATGFSYRDDRALADRFREELPLVTFDWFSEPILELDEDTSVLLTSSGSAGYLRTDFDSTLNLPDQDTFRVDEEIELSVPFHVGPIGIRPFVAARATYYDSTINGVNDTRWAFSAGAEAATWMAKSWSWLDDGGTRQALRHVITPRIILRDRFYVTGQPADYFQFDEVDAIDAGSLVRVELLQRIQRREGSGEHEQVVWLDLAQNFFSNGNVDLNADELDLFEYELIVDPQASWLPVPNLRLLLEGEYDWDLGETRTLNTGLRFGKVLGLDWRLAYRTDRTVDGAIAYGAGTTLFERWLLDAGGQYDLQRAQSLNYLARLTRVDHDWRLTAGVAYDSISNNVRFFIDFQPTAGGLFKGRGREYVSTNDWDFTR